jgi:hypothetical protein
MPAAFLCVQFRNLLPSEELVLTARVLWHSLQTGLSCSVDGEVVLTITYMTADIAHFDVELALPQQLVAARATSPDARAAVQSVFTQLARASMPPASSAVELGANFPVPGKSAPMGHGAACPGTGSAPS